MEVFDAELWVIRLALDVTIKKREILQTYGVKTVVVFSDWKADIRRMAYLDPGPEQWVASGIHRRSQALLTHGIAMEIHWVLEHSSIPWNKETDSQAKLAWEANGSRIIDRQYTWASNRARLICERRSVAKARLEPNNCNKHFGYRLKGIAGSKRPNPMASAMSFAKRFYQQKCGHVPTGAYLKLVRHWEEDKYWWCGGTVAQTWKHLLCYSSRWKYQQRELCKMVGKALGWKAGRCQRAQESEMCSIVECDKAVIDILVAMDVGKFPLGWCMDVI